MAYKTINELFLDYLSVLKDEQGIALSVIAKMSKIKEGKIRNIRNGRSSAKKEDLESLTNAYPDLKNQPSHSEENFKYVTREELEQYEQRISKLESQLFRALNRIIELENKLLFGEKDKE